jgi:hypothetical protein
MSEKIYINDIGLLILIDFGEDISGASGIVLEVITPSSIVRTDGVITNMKEWIPEIVDTNFLGYTTVDGDLNEFGLYKINPKFTLGGWTGHCDTIEFTVLNKGE